MSTRRVVTGTVHGKSVFVSDEQVEPFSPALMPGMEFVQLWGADEAVALPTDGVEPRAATYFPPAGGFRFALVTIPPESTAPAAGVDVERALAEVEERLPGLMAHIEPHHPGMHTTDTVDLDIVLSGEIWLELDDGAEVRLTAGDCVIQNGTRHAWHNRSSAPCTLGVAIVGAPRRG